MTLRPVRRRQVGILGEPGPMTEAQFQASVVRLARDLGWGMHYSTWLRARDEAAAFDLDPEPLAGLVFHPRFSVGSEPGWPDLALVRRKDCRFILAELKSEHGRVSPRQAAVIELLGAVGLEVYVWRPADLDTIAEVLR